MTRSSNSRRLSTDIKVPRIKVFDPLFPAKPSDEEVQQFKIHVKETGCPETYPFITCEPPSDEAIPEVLCKFDVDRKKRPDREMAPCSICSPYHPKCLEGMYLVWYVEEGALRAIGPECGLKLNPFYDIAIQSFGDEERRKSYINFIHTELAKIYQIKCRYDRIISAANEVDRISTMFRKKANIIVFLFRRLYKKGDGLSLDIDISKDTDSDNFFDGGPRGMYSSTGGQSTKTESVSFGKFAGSTFFKSKRSLVMEASVLKGVVDTLPECKNDEEAFEWLCENESLEVMERIFKDVESAISKYREFQTSFIDVLDFFDPLFLRRLHEWGTHPENPNFLQVGNGVYGAIEFSFNKKLLIRILPNLVSLRSALKTI